jgi:hypothetical protein
MKGQGKQAGWTERNKAREAEHAKTHVVVDTDWDAYQQAKATARMLRDRQIDTAWEEYRRVSEAALEAYIAGRKAKENSIGPMRPAAI